MKFLSKKDAYYYDGRSLIKMPENINDPINPDHYKNDGIETWDYLSYVLTDQQLMGFAMGNVHKYASRFQKKNGAEDLKKCRWYLNKAIEIYEK